MSLTNKDTVIRLNHLRDALVIAKESKANLNMDTWISSNYKTGFKGADTIKQAASCGTTCCNAGWAGLHPPLQKLGLVTTIEYDGEKDVYDEDGNKIDGLTLPNIEESLLLNNNPVDIICDDFSSEDSLEQLFNIEKDEAIALFNDDGFTADEARNQLIPGIAHTHSEEEFEYGLYSKEQYMTLDISIQLIDVIIAKYK